MNVLYTKQIKTINNEKKLIKKKHKHLFIEIIMKYEYNILHNNKHLFKYNVI